MKSGKFAFFALTSCLWVPVAMAQGTLTFKVPYKFTNISTEYSAAQIICGVSNASGAIGSAIGSPIALDANGSASGTANVEAKANPGKSLSDAAEWVCNANFVRKAGGSFAHTNDVAKAGTNPVGTAKGRF